MFSDRLKELRIKSNLTQDELGKRFSLTNTAISKYETGENQPDINLLIKLSDFFNVSTDYLIGTTDIKHPKYVLQELYNYSPDTVNKLNDILFDFKANENYIDLVHTLLAKIKKLK